ncbi:endo-1,4-beta-xylanase Z [Prevotella sp. A2931]|uniref:Endo-1,4-beta-xylanase Z n=1 Tax=Prevotella illustrans TaxID=2800387 RepID=A0ABS3M3U6_9BACT|nr:MULTISPECIES: alpha/beta hydrolase-fold protein [Prevotella]MBO1362861.1 endo-1,4-beta-xylanase Z [Prevotella illustrans]PTL25927.1 endo-1,4-beta-xylanase Z [Prevotella sp. oral taxon 820]
MNRKFFITSMLALATLPLSAQWIRTSTPNDTLRSVRSLGNGNVVLSIYAPEAKTVSIGGDIMPWGKKLDVRRADNGVWSVVVPEVKDGVYRYHFVVDGVNVYDPKSPTAGETSALAFIGSGKEFYAMKQVPHGAVARRYYESKNLKMTRRLHVWTPAGYEKSTDKLPVLYLIHGGGDTDNAWPGVGAAGFILDNLLAEDKIKPMIVVMPNGSIPTQDLEGEVPLFEEDLVKSVIPFIESNYRVMADKDHRAMAGLSMGGMETLETMLKDYDKFAYFWVLSSGWFANNKQAYANYQQQLNNISRNFNKGVRQLVFTQGGPEDIAYRNGKAMLRLFDKAGIKYEYTEAPGGHTWYTWRNNLYQLAQRIFK